MCTDRTAVVNGPVLLYPVMLPPRVRTVAINLCPRLAAESGLARLIKNLYRYEATATHAIASPK
jgi:hypothetical protein